MSPSRFEATVFDPCRAYQFGTGALVVRCRSVMELNRDCGPNVWILRIGVRDAEQG